MTTKKNNVEVKTVANAQVETAVETAVETVANVETITAKVTKVMVPQANDERITFVLDKDIVTIDFETGEEKQSNMFGLNIYALVNQTKDKVDYINLADTMAMGAMVNPQLIALTFVNSEITFTREFKSEGEVRKDGESVYAHDCYVTEIKKVTTHIKPIFEHQIEKLFNDGKIAVVTQVVANPFDI